MNWYQGLLTEKQQAANRARRYRIKEWIKDALMLVGVACAVGIPFALGMYFIT